jgi:hypothetical protein
VCSGSWRRKGHCWIPSNNDLSATGRPVRYAIPQPSLGIWKPRIKRWCELASFRPPQQDGPLRFPSVAPHGALPATDYKSLIIWIADAIVDFCLACNLYADLTVAGRAVPSSIHGRPSLLPLGRCHLSYRGAEEELNRLFLSVRAKVAFVALVRAISCAPDSAEGYSATAE